MNIIPLLLLAGIAVLHAQPRVASVGQAADFTGPLAPGSLATVFGSNLAPGPASAASVPLPTTLAGTTVRVNGDPVPLTFLNATQINFQLPAQIAPGSASLTVATAAGTSAAFSFTVVPVAPGVFQYGANRGVVQNQDYSLNTETNIARRGEVLTVYLTGIGATTPLVREGTVAPSSPLAVPSGAARAFLGGAPARVLFLGLTPGAVGLAQANVEVPAVFARGSHPVVIELDGVATMPVQVAVDGDPQFTLPESLRCVSGPVETVTSSIQHQLSGQADEVQLAGQRLCPACDLRPPLAGPFPRVLEPALPAGLQADVCYDSLRNVQSIRLRR